MKSRRLRPGTPVFILSTRSLLAALLTFAFVFSFGIDPAAFAAREKKPKSDPVLQGLPVTELTPDEAILHALNRLAYGPRPGEVAHIKEIGLARWIDQQLHPDSIDDSALDARLERFPTLKMSSAQLMAAYPQPKRAAKRAGLTVQEYKQQQAEQRRAAVAAESAAQDASAEGGAESAKAPDAAQDGAPNSAASDNSSMKPAPEDDEAAATLGKPKLSGQNAQRLLRALGPDSKRPQRVVAELAMAKVTRAIYSQRQLQQVMDDFWFNHFNVYAAKNLDKWLLTSYERDVIQPHTFGKFRDLLEATAKSPAMLVYLDNAMSVDPGAAARLAQERSSRRQFRYRRFGGPFPRTIPRNQQAAKQKERGLNENYGRELMELHTLGVDGGYTQKDVTEVARCFTGWTIERPRQDAVFRFNDRLHDPNPKLVLGKKIHAGGMKDGEEVLDLLARNPHTAKFISTKLARRFVSDNPPPALVDRMARTFESSGGDIRAVLHTMIYSPEFWSREAYRAKIKTPFELVVSAARALDTDVETPLPLVFWVARIGQPLYQCQPPTGYADNSGAWVNTGALLNRLNYSLALAGNKLPGSRSDVAALLDMEAAADPSAALDRSIQLFLDGQVAPSTRETLRKQLGDPQILQARLDDPRGQADLGMIAGLVLGAPEFQRR